MEGYESQCQKRVKIESDQVERTGRTYRICLVSIEIEREREGGRAGREPKEWKE